MSTAPADGGGRRGPNWPATLGILATAVTIGVMSTQLALNSLTLREKVAAPISVPTPDMQAALTPGGPRTPRTELPLDPADEPPPALDQQLGLRGSDTPASPPVTLPAGWVRYPEESATLPTVLQGPVHRLFVAVEEGLKHPASYHYRLAFLEPSVLRTLKKPAKEGTTLLLPPWTSASDAPGFRLEPAQWSRLQEAAYDRVVLLAFECATEPCTAAVINWDKLREKAAPSGLAVQGVQFEASGKHHTFMPYEGGSAMLTLLVLATWTDPEGL